MYAIRSYYEDLVMARNEADALIYQTEKLLNDSGADLDRDSKNRLGQLIISLKQVMAQEQVNEIKRLTEDLNHAVQSLSQAMYQSRTDRGQGGQTAGYSSASGPDDSDDDIVDAEFSEVA